MKKILVMAFFLSFTVLSLHAQSMYEVSFTFPNTIDSIAYKAVFIDNNDGKGKLRMQFTSPAGKDSILADIDVTEVYPEMNVSCFNNDRIYYKLQTTKYIESKDPSVTLPQYFCFIKDSASGLFELFGVTNSMTTCKADVVKFTHIVIIGQKDLTKEFVLTYFKPYDLFYRNLFVTNNSKALTTTERNTKLFLLFVANVTDPKIGAADRKNMNDAITFFSKIKTTLGIGQFIYDTIAGAGYSKQNVENKIQTFLTPGPNDIVVFYYSGHGFRKVTDGRPGPYIDMTVDYKKQNYLDNAIKLEDISDMIRKKGARLNLILSDCCNDKVTDTNPMADALALSGKKGGLGDYWSTQNARDLFLNATPTTIMATAAEPFQLAISNPVFGGFFSTFFRNAVETNLSYSKNKATWDDVFEQTKEQTETKSGRTWCNEAKTIKCNRQRPYVNIIYGRF